MNLLQDISTNVYTYLWRHITYVVHRIQQPIPDSPFKTIPMSLFFCQVESGFQLLTLTKLTNNQ